MKQQKDDNRGDGSLLSRIKSIIGRKSCQGIEASIGELQTSVPITQELPASGSTAVLVVYGPRGINVGTITYEESKIDFY